MSTLEFVSTVVVAMLASSGMWAVIQKLMDKKDLKTKMLIGLAHDRIIWLGMSYVNRGYITQDEYENLHDYLYETYKAMGGNGSAERVMKEVDKLELRPSNYKKTEKVKPK